MIEVLAVIAILLVVSAISLPVVEQRLAEARFDSAVRRVDAGMAWARAESQRRGEALRVEARAGDGGTGLFLEPLERPRPSDATGGAPRAASQPFASVDSGLDVSNNDPSATPAGDKTEVPLPRQGAPQKSDRAGAAEPLVLATFLPDGSAMADGPFYVSGLGKAASLAVNHWTGGVRVTLLDLTKANDAQRPVAEPEAKP